jgi:hypothetical protein
VVVPITDEVPPEGCKLYVLINQKDGLCKPYNCNQKQVFYFRKFRDSLSNAEGRKTSWNRKVLARSVRAAKTKLSSKQIKFAPAKETLNTIIDPTPDFHNDIVHLTASFAIYREPDILKRLKQKLELADEDLAERPLPSYPNLRAFLQRPKVLRQPAGDSMKITYDDSAFGKEEAQGVVDEAARQ